MVPKETVDWKAWHGELRNFAARESEGFVQDIEALTTHIRLLEIAAPKNKFGTPHTIASAYLANLKIQLSAFRAYIDRNQQ